MNKNILDCTKRRVYTVKAYLKFYLEDKKGLRKTNELIFSRWLYDKCMLMNDLHE